MVKEASVELLKTTEKKYRETGGTTQDEVVEVTEVSKLTKLINNRRLLNKDVTDVFKITALVSGYISDDVRYTINKGTAINQYDNETFIYKDGSSDYNLNKGAIIDSIMILTAYDEYLAKLNGSRDQAASPTLEFNVEHYVDLESDGGFYHETIEMLLGGTTSELIGSGNLYNKLDTIFDEAFGGKTIETIILDNIQNSFHDAYGTIYIDNVEYSKDKTTLDFIQEFGVAVDINEATVIMESLKSMPSEELNSYGVLSQIKKIKQENSRPS